jgi:mono/diheme cytochrome c family protein
MGFRSPSRSFAPLSTVLAAAAAGLIWLAAPEAAAQAGFNVGAAKCGDCHREEAKVLEGTKHAKSFNEVHRKDAAKAILAAAGGDSNMRRNAVCTQCHYTSTQADAAARANATAGPSCESCHGPASNWLQTHNDYGGPNVKREQETPANKTARLNKAKAAGMIHSSMLFEIAENCASCHSLARKGLDPAVMAKMIDAGHPAGSAFEFVQYSQGSVRHRFYPPDVTKNAEMTPAELSRAFVTGHAAALVVAAGAAGKVQNAKYEATRKGIEDAARKALDAVKG